jgi:hypothetical protein
MRCKLVKDCLGIVEAFSSNADHTGAEKGLNLRDLAKWRKKSTTIYRLFASKLRIILSHPSIALKHSKSVRMARGKRLSGRIHVPP